MRASSSWASRSKCASCPSSHAIRYCRPWIVTLTWDIEALMRLSLAHSSPGSCLRHSVSMILGLEHRANGFHSKIEAPGNLAVGRFESAGMGRLGIKICGQVGTRGVERRDL